MRLFPFAVVLILTYCTPHKERVQLLIHNARVYTCDTSFAVTEAVAVKDGSILATGRSSELLAKYQCDSVIDAKGMSVYPGFIDAHCHFLGYGLGLTRVNLVGTTSYADVVSRVIASVKKDADASPAASPAAASEEWVLGRG